MAPALMAGALLACALAAPAPARADEKASLANVLLAEQLVDVATTQQLLHTGSCVPFNPLVVHGRVLAVSHYCVVGAEADPLARPFVGSAVGNIGAALVVNGLVRLASRHFTFGTSRWLKLAIAVYPTVIIGNINSTAKAERFSPAATVTLRSRI
jgi:hypothetical protein